MPFYVHGQDSPGVGAELSELAEAHWSYMDQFADRLILRGPTLSDDGGEHTGSVHVVDLDDRDSAERFATGEPFWRAGLYRHLTIERLVLLQHREIIRGVPHALVTGEWAPRPRENAGDLDNRVRFAGLLVNDDQSRTTGIVAVVRAVPEEAASAVRADVPLTAQRWEPGGRR